MRDRRPPLPGRARVARLQARVAELERALQTERDALRVVLALIPFTGSALAARPRRPRIPAQRAPTHPAETALFERFPRTRPAPGGRR